jgi:hypothetical protein
VKVGIVWLSIIIDIQTIQTCGFVINNYWLIKYPTNRDAFCFVLCVKLIFLPYVLFRELTFRESLYSFTFDAGTPCLSTEISYRLDYLFRMGPLVLLFDHMFTSSLYKM